METTQIDIDGWIDKQQWYVHKKEYYLALKRKDILTNATAWMNFESIMLSEINQSQNDKSGMIPVT